jgi:hypothetical protein
MTLRTHNTFEAEIIGGIFSLHGTADDAQQTVRGLDFPEQGIQVNFHLADRQAREAYTGALVKAIRCGNILVPVAKGTRAIPRIEVIEDLTAENNAGARCRADKRFLRGESMPGTDSGGGSLSS